MNKSFYIDDRWKKIAYIQEALEDESLGSDYFIYFDADATVLDMNFDVVAFVKNFPKADLIVSADIRQGLINSGVMIIKNTLFSRELFHKWWTTVDRKVFCDQDAFDYVFTNVLTEEERSKVKILPMNSINSHPPAMKYQNENDPILHLMGEITELRQKAFQFAYANICASQSTYPKQLNLTRDVLQNFSFDVYSQAAENLSKVRFCLLPE
jgi:hypothetical protein